MAEQRTLREFDSFDSLFVDFSSLSDFDDIYTCDVCIDTHLCSICTRIEAALQGDISYEISTDKVNIADVNVALAAKILSSIEQPPTLELKPFHVFLEFNENLHVIILSKLEYEHEKSVGDIKET